MFSLHLAEQGDVWPLIPHGAAGCKRHGTWSQLSPQKETRVKRFCDKPNDLHTEMVQNWTHVLQKKLQLRDDFWQTYTLQKIHNTDIWGLGEVRKTSTLMFFIKKS